jgi:3-deoxy-D-manno-octulosonic-acid transferase
MYCLAPWMLLRLLLLGLRDRGYWSRWGERLALGEAVGEQANAPCIWIHAVSVGEVQASQPLLEKLAGRYPDQRFLITTVTPTGARMARQRFGARIEHRYLPFDLPGALRRFISAQRPLCLLIMETELWPNLIAQCGRAEVPVMLANARLSQSSYRGYRRLSVLVRPMLQQLSCIAAQSEADAQRLLRLGAPAQRLQVVGNVKYDVQPPKDLTAQIASLDQAWGVGRFIWIAASTHQGEEGLVLAAHHQVLSCRPDSLLILVPRHPDRCAVVESLARAQGFVTARRSRWRDVDGDTQVLIVDTLGELWHFYAASQVCFVGGSLVAIGGHNVLEPAALGKPILVGRHTNNFADICAQLEQADGLRRVSAEDLGSRVVELIADPNQRAALGQGASTTVHRNRGAVDRVVALASELCLEGIPARL